jgi:hypothetical protein
MAPSRHNLTVVNTFQCTWKHWKEVMKATDAHMSKLNEKLKITNAHEERNLRPGGTQRGKVYHWVGDTTLT